MYKRISLSRETKRQYVHILYHKLLTLCSSHDIDLGVCREPMHNTGIWVNAGINEWTTKASILYCSLPHTD